MALVAQVPTASLDWQRYRAVIGDAAFRDLADASAPLREALEGRAVWNVNTCANGGGVAEMLQSMVPYARSSGIDCRWVVIAGEQRFFAVTKRLHNLLHGVAGDGGPLDADARADYEAAILFNGVELRALVRPGDVVILHDPQTAGLARALEGTGVRLVWRCHIGADEPGERARAAQRFLAPYLRDVRSLVFSRAAHVWPELAEQGRVHVIPPCIDALTPKNQYLDPAVVEAIVRRSGLLPGAPECAPVFASNDGAARRVDRRVEMLGAPVLDPHLPIVTQVSRWDGLKDPLGVLRGFVEHVLPHEPSQLLLVGPPARSVADDPEAQVVLRDVRATWERLAPEQRRRVALACPPVDDLQEMGAIVNAIQRASAVVVQKSLAEGFGLTVTEAMWKSRTVLSTKVGGIQDQIDDGRTGVLLEDPADLGAFGRELLALLRDPLRRQRIGEAAHEHVHERCLPAASFEQWSDVVASARAPGRADELQPLPLTRSSPP